ncbi:MAG: Calx-beta domain-containing protein [Pseudomonadota bacterium]
MRDRPVVLQVDDKLVYSPHDYPASVFQQPWFTDGSNLYDVFRANWGFIYEEGIAPILLGEFGSRLQNPADLPWADAITAYLGGDFNGDGVNDLNAGDAGPSFAWWSWNPNSGDTGGYLLDDWVSVRQNAAELLNPLLVGDAAGSTGGAEAGILTFDVMLDVPAPTAVAYMYETRDGTALAGQDYEATSGTISFAAGQQTAQVTVDVLPDANVEGDETLNLVLTDLDGSEVIATGTILDDDDAAPVDPDPVDPDPVDPDPVDPDPADPDPEDPTDGDDDSDQGGGDQGAGGSGTYQLALDDWGSGFVARLYISPGETVTGGWTVSIATSATITNVWNAEIVDQANGILTLTNASWNASISATETIEVGIQGNGSAAGIDLVATDLPLDGVANSGEGSSDNPMDSAGDGTSDGGMGGGSGGNDGGDTSDSGGAGGGGAGGAGNSGPFVGGGQTYAVGQTAVITGFDPARDVLNLGGGSIHNQIPVDTPDGFKMLHMFNSSNSTLVQGVYLADLFPESFTPISDSHLQQDLSAALAYEDGSGLVRPNTVYVRSHQEGLQEVVDFNPATDKISFFYLSVRGDSGLNFDVEETAEGVRFFGPLTGQSMTLSGVKWSDLNSNHFEWRANQLEDNIAGRMGLANEIESFQYENVYSGKSVAMAGGVDRAPYHSQPDYTGTPIGNTADPGSGGSAGGSGGAGSIGVTVVGGSVTEADPGMDHMHDDGSSHVHDDGHRYITFTVSLDAPAAEQVTLTYETADGTAVADTSNDVAWDYHTATGSLTFTPGEQTQTVAVAIHPDELVEDTETFSFRVMGDDVTGVLDATGTILDDDAGDQDHSGMGGGTSDGGTEHGDMDDDGMGDGSTGADGTEHGDTNDDNSGSGSGGSDPFVGGGQTYSVGQTATITGFDPTRDVLDLGPNSIHNQIPVDTPDGFKMLHMFNSGFSTLVQGVHLADLHPENFAPIADSHLQQDISAVLAYEDGSGLVRPNTIYVRSHQEGLEEIVDFNPATDKLSFFYLSVRGDGKRNFAVEDTAAGARFFNPLTGQSLTLRDISFSDLNSSHFEWRANQLQDGIAGRMGLEEVIDGFSYPRENIFSGKSVAMAGLVDRAPYHSGQGYEEYTGTPIAQAADTHDSGNGGADDVSISVNVTGGSVTEADPGVDHMHDDGSSHVHDDGHRYITFTVSLDAAAPTEVSLTYQTMDETAVADTTSDVAWDYHTADGTLTFAPGEQTQTVAVAVHPDELVEDTETFIFRVTGDDITGVLEATGTILDDDAANTDTDGMGDGHMGDGHMGDDHMGPDESAGDGSEALDARLTVENDWGSGAVLLLEITNTEQVQFSGGWTVSFDFDPTWIIGSWNSEWESVATADRISVSDVGWNGTIGADDKVAVGFQLGRGNLDLDALNNDAEFLFV